MEHYRYIVVKLEAAGDERGMTVAELARRSDIPRKRLWYILDGQRQLRADELVRLSLDRWRVRSGELYPAKPRHCPRVFNGDFAAVRGVLGVWYN